MRALARTCRGTLVLLGLGASGLGCAPAEEGTWAMRPITSDHTFPARDVAGAVLPGGKKVSALDLEEGRMTYVSLCASCHGLDGDGRGPDAEGMRPPPRDFRAATFKFAAVRSGELPNDDDLTRLVRDGLRGTEMPPWGLDTAVVQQVIDFLKTFPPEGCRPGAPSESAPCERSGPWMRADREDKPLKKTGEPVRAPEDPWSGRREEAIRKGEELYHLTAQCTTCHPAYLGDSELQALSLRARGEPWGGGRSQPHLAVPIAADKNPHGVEIVPPDFTRDTMRSIRRGQELEDLYRVIAAGVGGVMPAWVDALPPGDLWALTHYVSSLAQRRAALAGK